MSFNRNVEIIKPQDVFKTIKCVLVSCPVEDSQRKLDELESLCRTAGIQVKSRIAFNLNHINPSTYIGPGQAQAVKTLAQENDANLIVFNFALGPRVQRNLEDSLKICVVDRQEIILQIFANRATTREARIQVELAQLEYSLPRLSRKWANLSQQRGGVKGAKGSGEKQLELDKRTAQNRIAKLKKDLKQVEKQRLVQRKNRSVANICNVAIVGYTNSGKSSLLNRISDASVLSEDKLFATLDPTTRKVFMPDAKTYLFTDTVGFVSDLPHELVQSFKSTLEEAKLSDILLIVLDASRDDMIECWNTTVETLKSLNAFDDKKRLVVYNKMDLVDKEIVNIPNEKIIKISVKEDPSMTELLSAIERL